MATSNKDFKIKNGLIVEGDSATVNGNDVLTTASVLDDLANVNAPTPNDGDNLVYDVDTQTWIPIAGLVGPTGPTGPTGPEGIVAQTEAPTNTDILWLDTDAEAVIPALTVNDIARIQGWDENSIEPRARGLASATVLATSGAVNLTYFTAPTNITVSQISSATSSATAASGVTLARMGLYEITGPLAGTLIARTANDTTLFTASSTIYTRNFDTADGFPSSVTLTAGTRYAITQIIVASVAGSRINYPAILATFAFYSPRLSGSILSQSDLPLSFTTITQSGNQHWGKLS